MECFNHNKEDAAGVCLACGRAICHKCTKEHESGNISCVTDFCVRRIEVTNLILQKNPGLIKNADKNSAIMPFFYFVFGLVICAKELTSYFKHGYVDYFFTILGIVFIVFSLLLFNYREKN